MRHVSSSFPSGAGSVTTALIIFAKAPIPGQVKTRLCPPLTPDEAATLHGSCVLDTLERTARSAKTHALSCDRYLACAPASTLAFFKIMEARHKVALLDQSGEDLGIRMSRAFEAVFAQGYRQVVLVGTDVPTLPLDYYALALGLLASHDLVLGPARDGGYYLIGLKRLIADLFISIPWSTDRVCATTQHIAARLGLTTALLPEWRDLDTIDDLQALMEAQAQDARKPQPERSFSSRTAGALQLIKQRLSERNTS